MAEHEDSGFDTDRALELRLLAEERGARESR
jgi:hypothetical protein